MALKAFPIPLSCPVCTEMGFLVMDGPGRARCSSKACLKRGHVGSLKDHAHPVIWPGAPAGCKDCRDRDTRLDGEAHRRCVPGWGRFAVLAHALGLQRKPGAFGFWLWTLPGVQGDTPTLAP